MMQCGTAEAALARARTLPNAEFAIPESSPVASGNGAPTADGGDSTVSGRSAVTSKRGSGGQIDMSFDLRCMIRSVSRRSRSISAPGAIEMQATVDIWMSRGVLAPILRAEDSPAHLAIERSLRHRASNTGKMPVPRGEVVCDGVFHA